MSKLTDELRKRFQTPQAALAALGLDAALLEDAFEEGKHPRGEGGKFTSAQGSAHAHLTSAGHEHTYEQEHEVTGQYTHGYRHPTSGAVTHVSPNGEANYRFGRNPSRTVKKMTGQLARQLATEKDRRPHPQGAQDALNANDRGNTMIDLKEIIRRPGTVAALRDLELDLRRRGSRMALDSADDLHSLVEHLSKRDDADDRRPGRDRRGARDGEGNLPVTERDVDWMEPGEDEMDREELCDFLRDKLDPEHMAAVEDMLGNRDDDADDRRRADDLRKHLGRDATPEELEEERRREAAEDARNRLGRDETPEEAREREMHEEGDRAARDARKHARDAYRRARDAVRQARDRRRAMDARRKLGRDATPEELEEMRREEGEDRARRRGADGHPRRPTRDRRPGAHRRADDEPPDFEGRPELVTREAMDSAVNRRVAEALENQRRIANAAEAVRPWVGAIATDAAVRTPSDVYRKALDMLGVPVAGVDPSAYATILSMTPRPGSSRSERGLAADAASARSFAEKFPNAARVRTV